MRTFVNNLVFCLVASCALQGCSFFTKFDEFEPVADAGVRDGSTDGDVETDGSTDGSVDMGFDPNDPLMFYAAVIRRYCALGRNCETKYPSLTVYGSAYCLPDSILVPLLNDSLGGTVGDLHVDGDSGLAFLESMDEAAENCSLQALGQFAGFFRGNGADGTGCSQEIDCQSGYCSADTSDMCGTCIAPPTSGSICDNDSDCPSPLYCGPDDMCVPLPGPSEPCPEQKCTADSYCQTGTCIARPTRNQVCTPPALPNELDECAGALMCTRVAEEPVDHRCTDGIEVGEDCGAGLPCARGARCIAGECVALLDFGDACSGGDCQLGLVCRVGVETTPTCLYPPQLGERGCSATIPCLTGACSSGACVEAVVGTPCGIERANPFGGTPDYCRTGWCDPDMDMCITRAGPSDSCTETDQCVATHWCNAGVCEPRGALNEACTSATPRLDESCLEGLHCIDSVCTSTATAGGACENADHCAEGLICTGASGDATCVDCTVE